MKTTLILFVIISLITTIIDWMVYAISAVGSGVPIDYCKYVVIVSFFILIVAVLLVILSRYPLLQEHSKVVMLISVSLIILQIVLAVRPFTKW